MNIKAQVTSRRKKAFELIRALPTDGSKPHMRFWSRYNIHRGEKALKLYERKYDEAEEAWRLTSREWVKKRFMGIGDNDELERIGLSVFYSITPEVFDGYDEYIEQTNKNNTVDASPHYFALYLLFGQRVRNRGFAEKLINHYRDMLTSPLPTVELNILTLNAFGRAVVHATSTTTKADLLPLYGKAMAKLVKEQEKEISTVEVKARELIARTLKDKGTDMSNRNKTVSRLSNEALNILSLPYKNAPTRKLRIAKAIQLLEKAEGYLELIDADVVEVEEYIPESVKKAFKVIVDADRFGAGDTSVFIYEGGEALFVNPYDDDVIALHETIIKRCDKDLSLNAIASEYGKQLERVIRRELREDDKLFISKERIRAAQKAVVKNYCNK